MRILVVEDEAKTARAIIQGLAEEGYAADHAGDGEEGLYLATENPYDVILLDVRLPRMEGTELCRRYRAAGGSSPILMLTANTMTEQKVGGLDAGADDYLTKPFEFDELLARIRALARRGRTPSRGPVLKFRDLALDPAGRVVRRANRTIDVTAKEFAILEILLRKPGEVVTRAEIMDGCWDMNFESDSNPVDVHVASLRRKLEENRRPRIIQTVRGAGYVLREDG
ncbi:MAG: response regulator transcription factor [Candidatus Hydrogenedentota bacterium]|mgnify:CR=1 FL=1